MLELLATDGGWQAAGMWIVDGDLLRFVATRTNGDGDFDEFARVGQRLTFLRDAGLPGAVWRLAEPIWVEGITDVSGRFPRAKLAREAGLRSAPAVPLPGLGGILGVADFFAPGTRCRWSCELTERQCSLGARERCSA